ncbi:hypothetical protein ACFSKM_15625 [Ancylobacter dichloromethanicus]
MEQLGSVLFIALDGDPPAGLDLDQLPDVSAVAARVKAAFEILHGSVSDLRCRL